MRVTLSAAVTADGYMDDDSPRRLIISTPGDWEEVYRLRAAHDAILAGAETLRRDDPSLLVRDQAARARRVQAGLKPDIAKVTLTRSGRPFAPPAVLHRRRCRPLRVFAGRNNRVAKYCNSHLNQ